jgi:hypothetical protein
MLDQSSKTATILITAIACLSAAGGIASAQSDERGLVLQNVTVSSGYTSIVLPPITLGGYLPQDVLSADMITTGSATIGWQKGGPRSSYNFGLSGNRSQRAKYTKISALGGSTSLGATHKIFRRWEASIGASAYVGNSDQLSFEQSQRTDGGIARPFSFRGYTNPLALAQSVRPKATPDIAQASLFLPVSQSLAATETYGNQLAGTGTSVGLSYTWSARLSAFGGVGFSTMQKLASSNEPGVVSGFPPSASKNVNVGAGYSTSRSTHVTVSFSRAVSTGLFPDSATIGSIGFGWSGRSWFTDTTVGIGGTKDYGPLLAGLSATGGSAHSLPQLNYSISLGHRGRTQSLRVRAFRGLNDAQGYGALWGKNVGIEGFWDLTPVRSKWSSFATIHQARGLGNFLVINEWHANASVSRGLGQTTRLLAGFFYDRHGSKGFEGFHLTRRGFEVGLTWSPHKRLL